MFPGSSLLLFGQGVEGSFLLESRATNTMTAIEFVAKKLNIPVTDITNVSDEWRMYLHDVDVKKPDEKTSLQSGSLLERQD